MGSQFQNKLVERFGGNISLKSKIAFGTCVEFTIKEAIIPNKDHSKEFKGILCYMIFLQKECV